MAKVRGPGRSVKGGDDEHRWRIGELHARMNQGLSEAGLTEARRRQYRQATRAVIGRMSPVAIQRLHANTREFRYYEDHAALTQAIKEKYPALAKRLKGTTIIKGMFDRDGTVHLDGGGTIQGRKANLADFYAHEFAHGIDGTSHQLSNSREWREVWAEDIRDNDGFSRKAREDHREAFSEVGSLLLGGGISARELALLYPGVVRFWRDDQALLAWG
jgi:hypothetical protein